MQVLLVDLEETPLTIAPARIRIAGVPGPRRPAETMFPMQAPASSKLKARCHAAVLDIDPLRFFAENQRPANPKPDVHSVPGSSTAVGMVTETLE